MSSIELSESEFANFQCIQSAAELPFLLFWVAGVAFTWFVATQNNFGLIDAVLASVGIRKFSRTPLLNALNILVVCVPMSMLYYSVQSNCT